MFSHQQVFLAAQARNQPALLATIVGIEGSGYRQRGARMVIFPDGSYVGSISSGCLEEGVVDQAHSVWQTGEPKLLTINTLAFYGCDGELTITLEQISQSLLDDICAQITHRHSFILETTYKTHIGTKLRIFQHQLTPLSNEKGTFSHLIDPLPRLAIVGLGLDAAAVGRVAKVSGIEVLHLLPPGSNLDGEPSGTCTNLDPENLPSDHRTGVLIMTHHMGRDATCLARSLKNRLAYVGLMGSRRRCQRVINSAVELEPSIVSSIDQLRAPVGLDLGSETPEEIALSIVAEFSSVLAKTNAQPLSQKQGLLHTRPELRHAR